MMASHAVVDTADGYTWTKGADGRLFDRSAAEAFAAERNAENKPDRQTYVVRALTEPAASWAVLCGVCAYEVHGYGKATAPVTAGACGRCGRDYDLYRMPDAPLTFAEVAARAGNIRGRYAAKARHAARMAERYQPLDGPGGVPVIVDTAPADPGPAWQWPADPRAPLSAAGRGCCGRCHGCRTRASWQCGER